MHVMMMMRGVAVSFCALPIDVVAWRAAPREALAGGFAHR
jgi:hypothetical protein